MTSLVFKFIQQQLLAFCPGPFAFERRWGCISDIVCQDPNRNLFRTHIVEIRRVENQTTTNGVGTDSSMSWVYNKWGECRSASGLHYAWGKPSNPLQWPRCTPYRCRYGIYSWKSLCFARYSTVGAHRFTLLATLLKREGKYAEKRKSSSKYIFPLQLDIYFNHHWAREISLCYPMGRLISSSLSMFDIH